MLTVEEIRANYKNFTDSKIEDLAKYESRSLRREILTVLKDEIISRNLDRNLITWVEAENDLLSDLEKKKLKETIKHLKCPNCLNRNGDIIAYEITSVKSLLFYFKVTKKLKFTCFDCAKKNKIASFFKIFLLGWWSKSGIIATPIILIKEIINFVFYRNKISNQLINDFIEYNNGIFRLEGIEHEFVSNFIYSINEDFN